MRTPEDVPPQPGKDARALPLEPEPIRSGSGKLREDSMKMLLERLDSLEDRLSVRLANLAVDVGNLAAVMHAQSAPGANGLDSMLPPSPPPEVDFLNVIEAPISLNQFSMRPGQELEAMMTLDIEDPIQSFLLNDKENEEEVKRSEVLDVMEVQAPEPDSALDIDLKKTVITQVTEVSALRSKEFEEKGPTFSQTFKQLQISGSTELEMQTRWHRFLMHPESAKRTMWDVFSAVALGHDSMMLPYQLAWEPPDSAFTALGMWATVIFWTLDMCVSTNTAYYTSTGDLETRRWKIIKNYLRRSFIVDAAIVGFDWFGVIVQSGAASEDSGTESLAFLRIVKFNRILRIMGVLRVSKIWDRLEQVHHMFASNMWQMVTEIAGLFLFLFWLNHILCCTWWAIGRWAPTDTGYRWVDYRTGKDGQKLLEASPLYQYTTAYHWSICQLTPGGMQAGALNSVERVFNICFLLCGLLFCTSLISRLSALMVRLSMAKQHQNKVVKVLRRFLRQHHVGAGLSARVEKQIVARHSAKRPLSVADVPELDQLSKSLRGELKKELYSPHLLQHAIFLHWDAFDRKVLCNLCELLQCRQFNHDDEIFAPGANGRTSYVIVSGTLGYALQDGGRANSLPSKQASFPELSAKLKARATTHHTTSVLAPDSWISAAALWVPWRTKGNLHALSVSEVVCIHGEAVFQMLAQHQLLQETMRAYQKQYAALFDSSNKEHLLLTDLGDPVDHPIVLMALPVDVKTELAEPLLDILRAKRRWRFASVSDVKDLQTEVANGKCTLVFKPDGMPARVAYVVVLRIEKPLGELLVRVADVDGNDVRPACRLPGSKLRETELPCQAVRRLVKSLQEDGVIDAKNISMDEHSSVNIEEQTSQTYNIMTQYVRHTFKSRYSDKTVGGPPSITWFHEAESVRYSVVSKTMAASKSETGGSEHAESGADAKGPVTRGFSDETLASGSIDRADVIEDRLPWLTQHWPDHIHWVEDSNGRGAIYAWMNHADFDELQRHLTGGENRSGRVGSEQPSTLPSMVAWTTMFSMWNHPSASHTGATRASWKACPSGSS